MEVSVTSVITFGIVCFIGALVFGGVASLLFSKGHKLVIHNYQCPKGEEHSNAGLFVFGGICSLMAAGSIVGIYATGAKIFEQLTS